ncbi:uncharacterized protein LOC126799689 [Argentina anserina]|uniref:uncharacterized protein LOC126799689 n=1 Tax=Argentina anserina TaxID=57926 RepID=UPI0021767F20|nr:uncharacterized protein LOC126799689 [Potentilla anserina]XP_050382893.1 uncharacterized protein LOC126799689 [Potentilla anserina]
MQLKPQGVMASNNLQQQGSKNIQTGRQQNLLTLSLTKGTTLEEFKNGFPSEGLSTASNRWWGSNSSDCPEGVLGEAAIADGDNKHQSNKLADDSGSSITGIKEKCESDKEQNSTDPQGTDLLVAVRRRAVEDGKKALKVGAFRGYGAKKLGRKERTLLLRIFKSSLPKDWIHDSS